MPGLVVEKINPMFLGRMLDTLPKGVVVVTGTNGKTTTTKIISDLLESQGLKVLTNKTGSNFVRGTVTSVIDNATLSGSLQFDIAVFELDEAHAVHFVHKVRPTGVVALNIMRDQMDRFGEIDTTAKYLQEVVASAQEWVVLNANDQRVAKLQPEHNVQTIWYGHTKNLHTKYLTDDELHHKDDLWYFAAGNMASELQNYTSSDVTIKLLGATHTFTTSLSGSHNAINLTASIAVLRQIVPEYDVEKITKAISSLEPAFGRGEKITLRDGTRVTLQLVKNPGGYTHALRMLEVENYAVIGMVINDDYADGRDVSWLWDVDFYMLEATDKQIVCGGTRAYDMAVRLKYDAVPVKQIITDISTFVADFSAMARKQEAIIFCTYTAMLKIRATFEKEAENMKKVTV